MAESTLQIVERPGSDVFRRLQAAMRGGDLRTLILGVLRQARDRAVLFLQASVLALEKFYMLLQGRVAIRQSIDQGFPDLLVRLIRKKLRCRIGLVEGIKFRQGIKDFLDRQRALLSRHGANPDPCGATRNKAVKTPAVFFTFIG